jgi:hypothetical protein
MNVWSLAVQQLQAPITMECYAPIEFKPKTSTKKCTSCKCLHPLEDFAPHPNTRDGRQSSCKACVNKRAKKKKALGKVNTHTCQWCGKLFGRSGEPKFCSRSCVAFDLEARKRNKRAA